VVGELWGRPTRNGQSGSSFEGRVEGNDTPVILDADGEVGGAE